MWWFLALLVLIVLYYFILHRHWYRHWSLKGVPGPRPWPLFGNSHEILLNTFCELELRRAATYGKCYGSYVGTAPWLTITDHRLIKQVLATDFPHFLDRMNLKTLNPFWNSNLLAVDGEHWRRIRRLTTPAFTGSKLRAMHPLMGQSVGKLLQHLNSTHFTSSSSLASATVQVKSIISCFAIDVIASTSFATETGAINSESGGHKGVKKGAETENAVVANCRQLFVIPLHRLAAIMVLPRCLLRLLNIDCFLPAKPFNFLIDLTRHIVRERKEAAAVVASAAKEASVPLSTGNGTKARADFVQLLLASKVEENDLNDSSSSYENLAAKEGTLEDYRSRRVSIIDISLSKPGMTGLTETEIIAQGIFFLTAGYETSSSTIAHALFELAHAPSAQERLYEELKAALKSLQSTNTTNGSTFRSSPEYFELVLSGLPYLEATLKETLRKHAPVQAVLRTAVTDGHQLENGLCLDKGQTIMIPVGAVHHCADYYPEPEVFRPERFLPENKHQLVPFTFLPFGAGPRNCVGIRFAMEEMKICLAALLEHYHFSPAPETPKSLSFQRGTPVLNATEFPLHMTKRRRSIILVISS